MRSNSGAVAEQVPRLAQRGEGGAQVATPDGEAVQVDRGFVLRAFQKQRVELTIDGCGRGAAVAATDSGTISWSRRCCRSATILESSATVLLTANAIDLQHAAIVPVIHALGERLQRSTTTLTQRSAMGKSLIPRQILHGAARHHARRKETRMKVRTAKVGAEAASSAQPQGRPSEDEVRTWIAEAAYYRAEKRGFSPGMETEDWIAAQAEVLARTRGARSIV
ncbi:MAG: DUF2934 domain-containing protein [Betaproteobacteria bacterium]